MDFICVQMMRKNTGHRGMGDAEGERNGFSSQPPTTCPVAIPEAIRSRVLHCPTNPGKRTSGLQGRRPPPRVPPPILFIANPGNLDFWLLVAFVSAGSEYICHTFYRRHI